MIKINFGDYINNVKLLAGRDNGEALRKKLDIEMLDNNLDEVEITIPSNIGAFNSSYFLGTFGISVRKLGRDGFEKKYKFICGDTIKKNIEDGINEALNNDDVFGGE